MELKEIKKQHNRNKECHLDLQVGLTEKMKDIVNLKIFQKKYSKLKNKGKAFIPIITPTFNVVKYAVFGGNS